MTAIIWVALQWLCSVLVLVLVSAVLAETSPAGPGAAAAAAGGGTPPRFSPGKRCAPDPPVIRSSLEQSSMPLAITLALKNARNHAIAPVHLTAWSRCRCKIAMKQSFAKQSFRVHAQSGESTEITAAVIVPAGCSSKGTCLASQASVWRACHCERGQNCVGHAITGLDVARPVVQFHAE